jgi:hypothetical protein
MLEKETSIAVSSDVDTVSREENAPEPKGFRTSRRKLDSGLDDLII